MTVIEFCLFRSGIVGVIGGTYIVFMVLVGYWDLVVVEHIVVVSHRRHLRPFIILLFWLVVFVVLFKKFLN